MIWNTKKKSGNFSAKRHIPIYRLQFKKSMVMYAEHFQSNIDQRRRPSSETAYSTFCINICPEIYREQFTIHLTVNKEEMSANWDLKVCFTALTLSWTGNSFYRMRLRSCAVSAMSFGNKDWKVFSLNFLVFVQYFTKRNQMI